MSVPSSQMLKDLVDEARKAGITTVRFTIENAAAIAELLSILETIGAPVKDDLDARCEQWTRELFKMVSHPSFTDRGNYARQMMPLMQKLNERSEARQRTARIAESAVDKGV